MSDLLAGFSDREILALAYDWDGVFARPSQRLPQEITDRLKMGWLALAGRGWGKTRVGAETIRAKLEGGLYGRAAFVAPTAADARDVMVEGESGILACAPPWAKPIYEPSKRRLTWPNGAIATLYSADEPERLRGPQHDIAWADELAAWRYPEAWDMLEFGLRLGPHPIAVVTTTPKPTKLVKQLVADPRFIVTAGSTFENEENLAASFISSIRRKYEGTRLGLQEIYARILDDNPNALWQRGNIDEHRVMKAPVELERIVVAIDPAVTSNADSDETGIVVAARGRERLPDGDSVSHFYVLADCSLRDTPEQWGRRAVAAYNEINADRIVGEVNNGGDLVETVLRNIDRNISYTAVRASRGKTTRAEPVAALYEQGRVHHVGTLGALEDQLCDYDPAVSEKSPDRMDALVWAITELMDDGPSSMLDFMAGEARKARAEQEARKQHG